MWYPTKKRPPVVIFKPCPNFLCRDGFVFDHGKNKTRPCLICKGVGLINKAA